MYIPRYSQNTIERISKTFKVLYVGGPRQVGKTTLLRYLAKKQQRNYVTLDDLTLREQAQKDPELFLQQFEAPLLIDEVQYAPNLFPYIKIRADESEKKGMYWLTGSQQFSVMKNVHESLAGRVGIVQLLGLSFAEIHTDTIQTEPFLPTVKIRTNTGKNTPTITELFQHIITGSFPELWSANAPARDIFYNSYIQTYIDRDLQDIFGIAKMSEFHTFMRLCAARTGQVLSYSDLARDAGVSVSTAKEWIGILQSTMHIYLLQPYHANISKRLIKSPKLYFVDTGLAAYLTKWKTAETLQNGAMAGAFFETFVVSEILKSYLFRGQEPPLYYFRDKEGHEVDLLIEQNQQLYPIEIKLASRIEETDLRQINYLRRKIDKVHTGAVVCLSPHRMLLTRETEIVPVSVIQ